MKISSEGMIISYMILKGCVILKKLSINEVRRRFEEKGYELLDEQYKNATTKLKYKCPKHEDEISEITLNALSNGSGCPYCAGNQRLSIEEVSNKFKERGYTLIEKEYKNTKTPLEFICSAHPERISKISYDNFRKGHGCTHCTNMARLSFEKVSEYFKKRRL